MLAAFATLGVFSAPARAQPCTTGDQFADQVQVLKSFDFVDNGGTPYQAPVSQGSLQSLIDGAKDSYIKALYLNYHYDMAAAFNVAPPFLQTALCSLERQVINGTPTPGVFIDREDQAPFAWSFWEVSTQDQYAQQQGSGVGRYIAVGAKVWRVHPRLDLSTLEAFILTHLLGENALGENASDSLFSTPKAVPPTSETIGAGAGSPTDLALMTVLAREVGLMIYHDYVAETPSSVAESPSSPEQNICPDSSGAPNKASFQSISWQPFSKAVVLTAGRIQKLGEETDYTKKSWKNSYVFPSSIRQSVNRVPHDKKLTNEAKQLQDIYNGTASMSSLNPEWADALAATTPYDDFAETFRLYALEQSVPPNQTTPRLKEITIKLPPTDAVVSMISNLEQKGSLLAQKAACIKFNLSLWGMP